MIVYLAVFGLAAVLSIAVQRPRESRRLAALFALFLLAFVGTRWEIGCDFEAYLVRFETLYQGKTVADVLEIGEAGFNLMNMAVYDAGLDFSWVLMICAALNVYALYRFSLLAPQPLSLMVTAFPVLIVQLAMSGLRQAAATALLMLAYEAFVSQRRWLVGGLVAVAALFHTSAFVFLPLAFLAGRQVSTRRFVVVLVLVAPLVGWAIGERLSVYSDRYIEQIYGENASGGAWIRYLVAVLPFLMLEWKRRLVREAFPRLYPLLRVFSLITISMSLIGLLSTVALHRMVFYVLPVSLLALACVTNSVFSRGSRVVARLLPLVLYGVYIVSWFTLSRHGTSCYIPYQSWLLWP